MACCGKNRARTINASPPGNTQLVSGNLRQATVGQPSPPGKSAVFSQPRPAAQPASPGAGQPAQGWTGPRPPVNVRYLEKSPVLVRGPATSRQYEFSLARPVQAVEAHDAEALLRTRFFRRDD